MTSTEGIWNVNGEDNIWIEDRESDKMLQKTPQLERFIIYVCFLPSILYMKLRAMEQVELIGKMRVFYLVWLKSWKEKATLER